MKLFELHATKSIGYDCYDSHVVIASSEEEARSMVPHGDEGPETWLNPEYSVCREVKIGIDEKPIVLCSSFNAG